jgi:hypothetical protein
MNSNFITTVNTAVQTGRVRRVYRMTPSRRAVSAISFAIGLFFLVSIWSGVARGTRVPDFIEMTLPLLSMLVAGILTMRAFRSAVLLSRKAIEIHSFGGRSVLPFHKIRGTRKYLLSGSEDSPCVWNIVLEPNDVRFPELNIREIYRFDESFYQWLNELPDLDAIDKHLAKS